jgi:hypothetical protein
MQYALNNRVSALPLNNNVAHNNSWVVVDNNAGRPFFAQANYITNFSDMVVSLSASNVDIGHVKIQGPLDTDPIAAVITTEPGVGALNVYVSNPPSSAVSIVNQLTSLTIDNPVTAVTVLNTVSSISIVNQLTALTINNPVTAVTILNPVTAVSIVNQLTALTVSNPITAVTVLNPITSVSLVNQLTSLTISNPVTSVTILNPVTAVSLINTVSTVNFTNTNITVAYGDNSGNLDAFCRLRVSTPTTLFDSKTLHNKASLFWSQLANGTGAAVNFTGEFRDASVTLSAVNVGEYAIRQTTQRFNYQPGKSQLALFTGTLKPEDHCIKRYGLFQSLTSAPYTPNVGLYFETLTTSPTSIAVVQANEGFLVPSLSATRDDWNIDKLDGSGPSKKILQLSAANIFLIDYEWLGVGRVRFGTVIDGQVCYCHQFNNAGNVQGAYIRTPNLPVRAELRQIATGTSELKMICSSVMSEGGADFTGVTRAVSTGAAITIAANVRQAVLGVRLQYNKLDSVNEVLNISGLVLASNSGNASSACFKYELIVNPTLAAEGTWTNVDENSNFQVWNGSSAINSGGTVIVSGYSGAGGTIDLSGYRFEKFLRLGCSVDGRRDELYLVMTPLQANEGVFGSITFIESD